jgi:endonuclease-3
MSEISRVIDIVEQEVRRFREPAVTQVARRRDPYQVLVSCMISLRTRDETTAAASERLFHIAKTPEDMTLLSEEEIERLIKPANYYRTKAKNIRKISHILIDEYGSRVPETIDELLKLPGVGRKTANIVVVFGHGKPGMPIDTHCHRIPNRLGWVHTKTPEQTERELRKLIPRTHWMKFNDIFVTFGQNICKPIRPLCGICPVTKYCDYYAELVSSADVPPGRKGGT